MAETNKINEIEKPIDQINEKLNREDLIKRYAEIQNISIEQAQEEVGAPTEEEILKKIEDKTLEKIRSTQVPMNRAQRRALKKKLGAKKYAELATETGSVTDTISDTAKKLNYIDLIQKLRKLNKEKEENGEAIDEDD